MRLLVALAAVAVLAAACGGGDEEGVTTGPDLEIERLEGYSVVVNVTGGRTLIGFSTDRNATSGDSYDVSESVWRVQDGPWNEPHATCLGKGQRIELGVTKVQNESQPGLLQNRVVWLSCLAPPAEEGQ